MVKEEIMGALAKELEISRVLKYESGRVKKLEWRWICSVGEEQSLFMYGVI